MENLKDKENQNLLSFEDIENLREGGKIFQKIKSYFFDFIKPGISGEELDEKALELFQKHSVTSAFHEYKGFPGNICISVNDCIIHGVPNKNKLKTGDKVTFDIGFKHKGIYIDSAFTVIIGHDSNSDYLKFIENGKKALWEGIKAVKNGCFTGDIAESIENFVKQNCPNYSIIDSFVGHGIGKQLHAKPYVPNKGLKKNQGDKLSVDQVICIEPMLLEQSNGEFRVGENNFDIFSKTQNAKVCHWEHMVLIKEDGIEILTADDKEIKEYFG